MKTAHDKRKAFRENLRSGRFMIAPGIYDALSAKVAEAAGLPCLAMGGYAISASRLGEPDVGLLSLSEMTEALKQICDATDIPVIGDGIPVTGTPSTSSGPSRNTRRPALPASSLKIRSGPSAAGTWKERR